ncbi:hypothetical protein [Gaetbulibacter saemankumensis]|uniref:hypothetical protein n=1 Tax=Gaetbulibacter saemankumensis TaxID=311208 RepID=UPI00040081FB|nr:hypothetical protein [Gaetbulibacter saemankumensis]
MNVIFLQEKQFVSIVEEGIDIRKGHGLVEILIPFKIQDGYHIQDLFDTKDELIPTEIKFKASHGCEVVQYKFVNLHYNTLQINEFEHRVISGVMEISVVLKCENSAINSGSLQGVLKYQTCNNRQCFFPRTLDVKVDF